MKEAIVKKGPVVEIVDTEIPKPGPSQILIEGKFSGHPTEVIPGGLEGVQKGLQNLKDGKASAVKYIFRIADTPWSKGIM
ncbi:hypothetical protein KVT40_004895 [Elsinoe batatas]|uniref:Uncharacterized protein n=1 Tax=Elsinoe batatas TaxID=2601811 RepID=A0A8K0L1K1_9PEZI|nr:hypothetical protein KVT40_004895 [Elsinoe batatas]